MNFEVWLRNGWLRQRRTTARDIADLLEVADRCLQDGGAGGLSQDGRMHFAYNAALACSAAALAACGYRADRDSHHYRLIQSLALTIGASPETVDTLDAFRKKRNTSVYERVGQVSSHEADEMAHLAEALRQRLVEWLRTNHAELLDP